MSIYLGEGKTIALSDMQGPAPDGFHVPLSSEWRAIYDAGVSLGAWSSSNGTNFSTYLKMPKAGCRSTDKSMVQVGSSGYYWSSTPYNTNHAYCLYFYTSGINPQDYYGRSNGFSVRCLQNSHTIPTTSWTILYQGSGSAGIYHNPTDGLISISSDGTTWYTIMDKNLGATIVYNYGDTLTNDNCGSVFQWGNNYPFPGTKSSDSITTSSTQVNVTGYGPGNYYESSTWIIASPRQSSASDGNNLRGGVSQGSTTKKLTGIKEIYLGGGVNVSDMQGPCPAGFHIPLKTEWQAVYGAGVNLGAWITSGDIEFSTYLKLPKAGYSVGTAVGSVGSDGYYWSSSPSSTAGYACMLYFSTRNIYPQFIDYRYRGCPIRCFKDSPAIPTSSWTVLYQGSGNAGIYHNPTDGLISISSDGTTWITIQDKNLGATTVYNYGDTLSVANTGNTFQWGNNYPFPSTSSSESITTSTTQVDTTGYGPGNYYSSSTFIKISGDWSNPSNDNLRGAVSQGTSTKPGIKAVYVGGPIELILSDMQGPAPDGFRVPLYTDWEGLNTIMSGLGLTTGDSWRINLHMPFAGYRSIYGSLNSVGSKGTYWSSSPFTTGNPDNARYFSMDSSGVYVTVDYCAFGRSVRCFKNSFEIPTSSWTVINGTLGSAGIFWNQTDGIISITSDGTTGYTIQDKNLGATSIYNDGDTLTQDNMGNMYQRGNNYGFPSIGDISNTSYSQVNAQNYGPGHYYSSDTFIKSNTTWDSSKNRNIRGGVSQGTSTKIEYNKIWPKEE